MLVRWGWLLVGAAAEAPSVLSLSLLQQKHIDASGTRAGFSEMIPIPLASHAVALSVPASPDRLSLIDSVPCPRPAARRRGADAARR